MLMALRIAADEGDGPTEPLGRPDDVVSSAPPTVGMVGWSIEPPTGAMRPLLCADLHRRAGRRSPEPEASVLRTWLLHARSSDGELAVHPWSLTFTPEGSDLHAGVGPHADLTLIATRAPDCRLRNVVRDCIARRPASQLSDRDAAQRLSGNAREERSRRCQSSACEPSFTPRSPECAFTGVRRFVFAYSAPSCPHCARYRRNLHMQFRALSVAYDADLRQAPMRISKTRMMTTGRRCADEKMTTTSRRFRRRGRLRRRRDGTRTRTTRREDEVDDLDSSDVDDEDDATTTM